MTPSNPFQTPDRQHPLTPSTPSYREGVGVRGSRNGNPCQDNTPKVGDVLASLNGQRIPGGCEDCDAYQTVRSEGSVHLLTVHHDDWCSSYGGHAS